MVASAKITIRLTHDEARILRSQAIRLGLSLSAFARRQILHGGSADAVGTEEIVSQMLPVVEAHFDGLRNEMQAIKSEARQIEDRATDRLKKAVQIIVSNMESKNETHHQ